jgi:hypothetical protein
MVKYYKFSRANARNLRLAGYKLNIGGNKVYPSGQSALIKANKLFKQNKKLNKIKIIPVFRKVRGG